MSGQSTGQNSKLPPIEDILLAYVDQLADRRAGCRAICLHTSRLSLSHRGHKHVQIATNLLKEIVDRYTGRLFVLRGGDMVVVCKGITAKAIEDAVEAIRYIFAGDEFLQKSGESEFYSAFDLEIAYPQFRATIQSTRDKEATQLEKQAQAHKRTKSPHGRVSELVDLIASIDLSNALQRQTVWALHPGKKPQPKFDELFVSIERLRKITDLDFDIREDRQLFQYLTQSLDKHILTRLVWEQVGMTRPVSININVATLTSPDFLKFETARDRGRRGRMILELQLGDLWADISQYLAIADRVKQRGYLRCLDGVNYRALQCLNFEHLPVDLVKVTWDEAMLRFDESALRIFCKAIAACGSRRVILIRCGGPEAIQFGQAIGIHLFQGWHLDRMIPTA